jgi:hypothetical protein
VHDEVLHWHGVHAGEISSEAHCASRKLALDLFDAFSDIDGLSYRSRFDSGQINLAISDRLSALDLVPTSRLDFDKHPLVIDEVMKRHGAAFNTSAHP